MRNLRRLTLRKEGFRNLIIRKWSDLGDENNYEYHMLCHTSLKGDEYWKKINLSNEEIEKQIEMYKV